MSMERAAVDRTEALLRPEVRAGLPFGVLVRLYLDPGMVFKDASRGSWLAREQARRYNERHRWMLLLYVRRWMTIAAVFLAGVAGAESLGRGEPAWTFLAAGFAVASCIAVTVSFQTAMAHMLLRPEKPGRRP